MTGRAMRIVATSEHGWLLLAIGFLLLAQSAGAGSQATKSQAAPSSRPTFVFKDSSTDRVPAKTTIPNYPRIARRDRIEGDATVCFNIDFNGRIRSPRVEHYTHRIFRRPSLKAIRGSSFEPLAAHERLPTERVCRTYRFRLEPVLAEN